MKTNKKISKEKSLIKRALAAIKRGNSMEMKKSIEEALLSKVRRKILKKEKQMAKSIFKDALEK